METFINTHILLIADQPADHGSLIRLLRSKGCKVSCAASPKQGYLMALALRPRLIVIQAFMSRAEGFTICRRLRETTNYRLPPVIFFARSSTLEHRLTAFKLGAVDFVHAPFAPEEMAARIRVHVHDQTSETNECSPTSKEKEDKTEDEKLLSATLRLIEEMLPDPISLETLSLRVGSNEKSLTQVFRQHLGITIFAYIRQRRINEAKQLLKHTELTVQTIALQVGYSSAANFATAFKALESMTPRQYRAQNASVLTPLP